MRTESLLDMGINQIAIEPLTWENSVLESLLIVCIMQFILFPLKVCIGRWWTNVTRIDARISTDYYSKNIWSRHWPSGVLISRAAPMHSQQKLGNFIAQTVYYSANSYRPTIKWLFCTFEYFMHTFMHTDGYFYFMPQFYLTSIICWWFVFLFRFCFRLNCGSLASFMAFCICLMRFKCIHTILAAYF